MRRTGDGKKGEVSELWIKHTMSVFTIVMTKSSRIRWSRQALRMGQISNAYKLLTGKPGGNKIPGRPKRWWKDNINSGELLRNYCIRQNPHKSRQEITRGTLHKNLECNVPKLCECIPHKNVYFFNLPQTVPPPLAKLPYYSVSNKPR